MGCMSTGGVVLPEQVTAYGIIIESESLMKDSGVINNQVTLDYQVADFINVFQVRPSHCTLIPSACLNFHFV